VEGARTARRLVVATAVALVVAGTTQAAPEDKDVGHEARAGWPETVARVNGEAVTRIELERLLDDPQAFGQIENESGAEDTADGVVELALRELTRRRLLLQEAERRGMKVTEDELDQGLASLRGRFPDLTAFGIWMKERGLDDTSLFETVEVQVLMSKVWAELVDGVRVSEDEVRRYYETMGRDLVIGAEVRLGIIVVPSEAAAEEVIAALRGGASFTRVAREHSLGLRAARGGDTGWVDMRALPSPILQAVGQLEVGDVAGPLERNPDELLLVALAGRRPVRAQTVEDARPEIERRLLPEARKEFVESWLDDQEETADIEILIDRPDPQDARVVDHQQAGRPAAGIRADNRGVSGT
jgi:parvulin-like peptidyl-prolyl isomerase